MSFIDTILIALLLLFMSIHVAAAIKMYQYVIKRGEKFSLFLLRLQILSSVRKYSRMTKQESGQTGYLFYIWIISVNLSMASFIAMIVRDLMPLFHEYIIVIANTEAVSIVSQIILL